jgi:hypothetical protein
MTFSQYQQLVAAAKKQIAEKVASIQPRGGNQVSVIGDGIAVERIDRGEDEEPPPETWEYVIYGTITTEETGEVFGPHIAARIARPSSAVLNDGFFEQETQVFSLPATPLTVTKKVKYFVTTLERDAVTSEGYPKGIYRGGLKLTCEFFEDGGTQKTFVRNYTLNVNRNGDSVTLIPPEPNKAYNLTISAAERL